MTIEELIKEAHQTSRDKGWWDEDLFNVGEKLALIHSEISEALEAARLGDTGSTITTFGGKPDGFAVELADAIIRIADLCGYLNIDLTTVLWQKLTYNKTRPHRHGGKRF